MANLGFGISQQNIYTPTKDLFVEVISQSTTAITSTDGITWTESTLPTSTGWKSVAYGSGKFIAIAYYSSSYGYTTDAATTNAIVTIYKTTN